MKKYGFSSVIKTMFVHLVLSGKKCESYAGFGRLNKFSLRLHRENIDLRLTP